MTALFRRTITAAACAAMLLAGCNKSTQPATDTESGVVKAASIPAEIVTAKTAFGPMYKSALAWSNDAILLRITPKAVPGFQNSKGKAAMWEATFASPTRRQYRVYDYSIAASLPDIHKGVSTNIPLPWAGQTRDAMPIDLMLFSVDSDAAYQSAANEAAKWLDKNAGKELTSFDLGSTYKFQAPVWYVQWGDKKSGYIALVDATSGKVYKSK